MSEKSASKGLTVHTSQSQTEFVRSLRYSTSTPLFAAVQSADSKDVFTRMYCDEFCDCRELAVGNVRAVLANMKQDQKSEFAGFDKLRYLVGYTAAKSESLKKCCTVGLRILNGYDRLLGVKPTTIRRVDFIQSSKDREKKPISSCEMVLVEADKKWSKAPQLVSLHMLLFRLGRYPGMSGIMKIPVGKIPSCIEEVAGKRENFNYDEEEDAARAVIFGKTWIKVLKQYDKNFATKKFSTTYALKDSYVDEVLTWEDGIDNLCEKMTGLDFFDELEKLIHDLED